ncbi:hypothetical protein ACLIKD_04820 [Azonexus sp. IMCC34842]|uniref:hypothetical protein n=1 Tax=Azonexus sp. IMCC34842 TaxID=3420950 RepID=UPI003D0BD881
MQQFIFSNMTSTFGGAMFASIDDAGPGYMALRPHIPAARHISPPSILENNLANYSTSRSVWPSSAEALARMDGCFPEYMAKTPSALR